MGHHTLCGRHHRGGNPPPQHAKPLKSLEFAPILPDFNSGQASLHLLHQQTYHP
jgi:hypothetical protein